MLYPEGSDGSGHICSRMICFSGGLLSWEDFSTPSRALSAYVWFMFSDVVMPVRQFLETRDKLC